MQKRISILWSNSRGVSPVIGVILMAFMTILLAGVTVSAVYGDGIAKPLTGAPMAVVEVKSVEGGVPNSVKFKHNFLYLEHKGGDPLFADSTGIVITGEGSSNTPNFIGGQLLSGDAVIRYDNLLFDGKESPYATRNPDISDGVWSTGEHLVLNGYDSVNGTSASSVYVSIDGNSNTSNNYGLKENGEITIKIFDTKTQCLIAECKCIVTPAE